jgi:cation transport ATPase
VRRLFPTASAPDSLTVPSGTRLAVDLGVGLVALANLFLLSDLDGGGRADAARLLLAVAALVVAGAPPARRALGLLHHGVLDRDALASAAAFLCFTAGVIGVVLPRVRFAMPAWMPALGLRGEPWHEVRAVGFESAAAIAVAALIARAVEAAVHRGAIHALLDPERAGPPGDRARIALDAEVQAALGRLAESRVQAVLGTWDDAAVRGVITAALGCASFAMVTHGWLGDGILGPLSLLSAAAVLAGVSPASLLVAAPAARARAILRARASGILVKETAALLALAGADAVCFEQGSSPDAEVLALARALHDRGVRAVLLDAERPETSESALLIRNLQLAGGRVVLVGNAVRLGSAHADVAVALAAIPGAGSAPIVVPSGRLGDVVGLIDLGRALRAVLRRNAVMGATLNAILIPAAALGYISPLRAALLVLAETLFGLAGAARLLPAPAARRRLALRPRSAPEIRPAASTSSVSPRGPSELSASAARVSRSSLDPP